MRNLALLVTLSALLGALLAMTCTALAQVVGKAEQPNPADPVWNFNTAAATLAKVGDAQLANAAYAVAPAFFPLRFGAVKPRGWILEQMRRDLRDGFAGHLDELCHEASSDIFASGRNRPGKPNAGNAAGDAWWNGETEGNWRCGHFMLACLTGEPDAMTKAKAYIDHILAAQDADGYLGIFSPELRYKGNGELWTQTCLFRGLLAYADATGDETGLDGGQTRRGSHHCGLRGLQEDRVQPA